MTGHRYKAFISYAHADKRWATWLHRKLESYRIPKRLRSELGDAACLKPIFRDRDELAASGQLGAALQNALAESEYLILICSPASARSHWVNEEVKAFRTLHGSDRILPLIVAGRPGAGDERDCFPPALTAAADGGVGVEPIGADAQKSGDGPRTAFLKIVAGLLGIGLDKLVQRDNARRQRRLAILASASTAGMVGTMALASYAEIQRRDAVEQRTIAERNQRTAEATVDFLINTFEIANPATETADTITARSVLDRGASRIEQDLAGQPLVQARLYTALGEIFSNLGLFDRSAELLKAGFRRLEPGDRGAIVNRIVHAEALYGMGELGLALAELDRAERLLSNREEPDLALLARVHSRRGFVLRAKVKLEEALNAFASAIDLYAKADGDQREEALQALRMQGLVLTTLGRFDEAERTLAKALAGYRGMFSDNHQRIGQIYNGLALNAVESGEVEAALDFGEKSLSIYRATLAPPHPNLARAYMLQGRAYQLNGDLANAEGAYREALEIFQQAYPDGYFETGFAQTYLALIVSEKGRTAEALRLLDHAKQQYDLSYDGLNANHGDLEVHRAIVLDQAGRREDAREACLRGKDVLSQTIGVDSHAAQSLLETCRSRRLL